MKKRKRNRPVPEGFTRKSEETLPPEYTTLEEMMVKATARLIPMALRELQEQMDGSFVRPFRAFADIPLPGGYNLKIEIVGEPPSLDDLLDILGEPKGMPV